MWKVQICKKPKYSSKVAEYAVVMTKYTISQDTKKVKESTQALFLYHVIALQHYLESLII